METTDPKITPENYEQFALRFNDRQAGVSIVYDPERDRYSYNAYCIETKLYRELYTCEFEFVEDAVDLVNTEFGSWDRIDLTKKKSSCGSCVAKPQ